MCLRLRFASTFKWIEAKRSSWRKEGKKKRWELFSVVGKFCMNYRKKGGGYIRQLFLPLLGIIMSKEKTERFFHFVLQCVQHFSRTMYTFLFPSISRVPLRASPPPPSHTVFFIHLLLLFPSSLFLLRRLEHSHTYAYNTEGACVVDYSDNVRMYATRV